MPSTRHTLPESDQAVPRWVDGGPAEPGSGDNGPPPRHRVVLWTTPRSSGIGKGQARTGIARISSCRRGEARASRTLNRARSRQRRDARRLGVVHRDGLAGCAAVIATVGRSPGPRDRVVLWATPGRGRIGKGQARVGIAIVRGRRATKARCSSTFNGTRAAYSADGRVSGVIDRDSLGAISSIAVGVGGSVGAGDDVVAT